LSIRRETSNFVFYSYKSLISRREKIIQTDLQRIFRIVFIHQIISIKNPASSFQKGSVVFLYQS
jgi:hypothetical protein